MVLGIVGAVGALITAPSAEAQIEADARRKLFMPTEDDMRAVERGVDGINRRRREACTGEDAGPSELQSAEQGDGGRD